MGILKGAARKRSATVMVKGQAKFPIPDAAHARAALARIGQAKPPLTASQKAAVKARANKFLKKK
jgi:hypothetical protein